jgi:hypothetical protein
MFRSTLPKIQGFCLLVPLVLLFGLRLLGAYDNTAVEAECEPDLLADRRGQHKQDRDGGGRRCRLVRASREIVAVTEWVAVNLLDCIEE